MNEEERKQHLAFLSERRDMWRNDKNLCELKYLGCKYLLQHHKASLWATESTKCDNAIMNIDKKLKEINELIEELKCSKA